MRIWFDEVKEFTENHANDLHFQCHPVLDTVCMYHMHNIFKDFPKDIVQTAWSVGMALLMRSRKSLGNTCYCDISTSIMQTEEVQTKFI